MKVVTFDKDRPRYTWARKSLQPSRVHGPCSNCAPEMFFCVYTLPIFKDPSEGKRKNIEIWRFLSSEKSPQRSRWRWGRKCQVCLVEGRTKPGQATRESDLDFDLGSKQFLFSVKKTQIRDEKTDKKGLQRSLWRWGHLSQVCLVEVRTKPAPTLPCRWSLFQMRPGNWRQFCVYALPTRILAYEGKRKKHGNLEGFFLRPEPDAPSNLILRVPPILRAFRRSTYR